MKTSKLIEMLKRAIEDHGDLHCEVNIQANGQCPVFLGNDDNLIVVTN